MTVEELKRQLDKMPDGWPVFINTDPDTNPDVDRLCFMVFQDLVGDVVILKGCN